MLFHFLNFSQCAVCMFWHKTIYKVTNLKVHSKGRYFVFKKNQFSRTTTNGLFGLQSCFPVFVTSQIVNPTYVNLNGWQVGRMLCWALHVSKSKPGAGVFVSLYFWWNPTVFRKFGCHFHFILHVMSDKEAFVSGALFCVQRYRGNLALSRSNSASRWQKINLHIYAATNSVTLCLIWSGQNAELTGLNWRK